MGLQHNWKFNNNTYDTIIYQKQASSNYTPQYYSALDLIIQPDQLTDATAQLPREITNVTYQQAPVGTGLKWNGTGICAAYAKVDKTYNILANLITNPIFLISRPLTGTVTSATQSIWITCWIRYDGTVRPGFKFVSATTPIEVSINTGTSKFTVNNTDVGSEITTGQWYFLSILFDPNRSITKLYAAINNGTETEISFPQASVPDHYTEIYCYDGLNDLRIYDDSLKGSPVPPASISEIYSNGSPTAAPESSGTGNWKYPYTQYKFNDNGIDTISNGTTVLGSNTAFIDGHIGKSLKTGRDNTSITPAVDLSYAAVSYHQSPLVVGAPNNFSLSFWCSLGADLTGATYKEAIFDHSYAGLIYHDNGYKIGGYGSSSFGLNNGFLPLATYPLYDHIVIVYQQYYSRAVVYINGVPRLSANAIFRGSGGTVIHSFGKRISQTVSNLQDLLQPLAYFDDVRTYYNDLTNADILALYSGGIGTESATAKYIKPLKTLSRAIVPTDISHSTTRSVIGARTKKNASTIFKICGWHITNSMLADGKYHHSSSLVKSTKIRRNASSVLKRIEQSKTSTTSLYNVYAYEKQITNDNLLLKENRKEVNALALNLAEIQKQNSSGSFFYTAKDAAILSNLYLPKYGYTNNIPKTILGTGKGRFTSPSKLPKLPVASTNINQVTLLPSLPKFPTGAQGGQLLIDDFGNRWLFNAVLNAWISKGDSKSPNIANDLQDGIATPEIYDKINYLKNYSLPPYFKMAPNSDAYYYYLRSSDKSIIFTPESDDTIRIELDQGRLFSNLYRQICPGLQGPTGDAGINGKDGALAPDELAFVPQAVGALVDFKAYAYAPLRIGGDIELPNNHVPDISLRLYSLTNVNHSNDPVYDQRTYLARYFLGDTVNTPFVNRFLTYINRQDLGLVDDQRMVSQVYNPTTESIGSTILAEILIDPTGNLPNRINVIDETIGLLVAETLNSIVYDDINCVVYGTFYFSSTKEPFQYAYKCMQMGPDGKRGEQGTSCLQVTAKTVIDQSIVATKPLINLRYEAETKTFYTYYADINLDSGQIATNLSAKSINLLGGNDVLNDRPVFDSVFLSAETTLKTSKSIMTYVPKIRDYKVDSLDLVNWNPTSEIRTNRHWNSQDFPWYKAATDKSLVSVSPSLAAIDIIGQLAADPAEDQCCQEAFFYMPDIQDGPCDNETPSNGTTVSSSPTTGIFL